MPESPRHPRAALRWTAPLMAGALALTSCSAADDAGRDGAGTASETGPAGTLTVLAAASLTDVFTELAEEFEADNPGVEVELSFAGSSALATQINSGAPADVFASANTDTMALVVDGAGLDTAWAADHGEDGAVFATNTLRIAVPADNPAGVEDLADLSDDSVATALCAPEVPCGAATAAVTDTADVEIAAVTLEQDVRAVLTKVELGEVDAGLVYATDVAAAGDAVEGIDFPESGSAVNEYPVGVLAGAPEPELAAAWVDLVLSDTGADVLTAAGFGTP
ncbi:molybdate ABC transporter substrate-binding protein [Nocardiopsis sp. EMB25]|uniref:molybdate ABC transporter substrate-binding protein n=1 Tax=Nocardiopsis sp. EMB25 TaxID=2835867 RepID=UPI002283881B|nr:molybdate ABC transporter substrate-binding protein [Nocardiopsis sp. EMB25]MCY9784060.1 molybdate ABC transporter substrate-binding protein [Nocardiopsis sp. EMB25]